MTHTDLPAAIAAREAARAKHTEASAALERARQAHAAAAAEVERLAAEEASWVSRHSRKLSEWISAGCNGPRPEPKADAAALVKQASARAQLSAAQTALESFAGGERDARQQLANAESAVRTAALAIVTLEGDELAREIVRRDEATSKMREQLLGLRALGIAPTQAVRAAIFDPLNTPANELHDRQRQIDRRDPLRTPIGELGVLAADASATAHWRSRLAAILSGADLSPSSAPAERAA